MNFARAAADDLFNDARWTDFQRQYEVFRNQQQVSQTDFLGAVVFSDQVLCIFSNVAPDDLRPTALYIEPFRVKGSLNPALWVRFDLTNHFLFDVHVFFRIY